MTLQDLILKLSDYWAAQGCLIQQPLDLEMGAGTMHPETFLRVLGTQAWNVAYVQPSRRPADGRFGENPNRLFKHHQFQVILKPAPDDVQDLYLQSLEACGIDLRAHDVRFEEDNWESPTLGAWGIGWQVMYDGLEITQFTYFQQAGGVNLSPISVELTYGLERFAMSLQGVDNVYDLQWAAGVSYREVRLRDEVEQSKYAFGQVTMPEGAFASFHRDLFERYHAFSKTLLDSGLVLPALDYCLKCSHVFNILDSSGSVGVTERTSFILRVRQLAVAIAGAWIGSAYRPRRVLSLEAAMDRELLLEIGVEELPASWLPGLTAQLAARLTARLNEEGLPSRTTVEAHGTPRRLTACQPELVDRQEDREETVTGPPVSAAFDADGHPTNAGLGFARKLGVDFDAIQKTDTPKGKYLTYLKHIRGKATVDVLPVILGRVLRDLTFPKTMNWDAQLDDDRTEFTFGRPIRWLLFLYGGRVVPFTIARSALASSPRVQDVTTGAVTYGHRFLATSGRAGRAIKVRSFDEYRKRLTENFVILSRIDRRDRIMRDLDAHARKLGGRAMLHQNPQAEALLDEVPDLVEFPAVVAGVFNHEFLTLPPEVLTTTLIHHQHYFPVLSATGALMPAFLAVTNTQASNDRTVATNAERVVTARLRDARFFWDADRKAGLESKLPKLDGLLFHRALGSYRQKAERIERLAGWLAADVFGQPGQADAARRAARLAKADLATDMVRELTELQGVMGGVYAREAGEPEAVWKAIYHHYLPVAVESGAGPAVEALGAARVTWACVSLADKLDTLVGFFLAGERPTGSRDPLGLRRQAHGVLRILMDLGALAGLAGNDARPALGAVLEAARKEYGDAFAASQASGEAAPADGWTALDAFMRERLEYVLQQRGWPIRNIRAVVRSRPLSELRPADIEENLRDLAGFSETESFRKLAEAFKRVRNIARELTEPGTSDLRAALTEQAEIALLDEIERRERAIHDAAERGRDFKSAYAEAAAFEPAVAKFFTEVFVMAEDARLRDARLRLMKRLESLILQLGDISEIVAVEA